MYSSTRNFPELEGLTSREKDAVLKAAMEVHDPSAWKRFTAAVIAFTLVAVSIGPYIGRSAGEDAVAGGLLFAVLFHPYMLWEINGPARRSLKRYLSERQ